MPPVCSFTWLGCAKQSRRCSNWCCMQERCLWQAHCCLSLLPITAAGTALASATHCTLQAHLARVDGAAHSRLPWRAEASLLSHQLLLPRLLLVATAAGQETRPLGQAASRRPAECPCAAGAPGLLCTCREPGKQRLARDASWEVAAAIHAAQEATLTSLSRSRLHDDTDKETSTAVHSSQSTG